MLLPHQHRRHSSRDEEQEEERGPLVVIPYMGGMSEDIRCVCCRKFSIIKSEWTLHLLLTKVKDTSPLGKYSMWYFVSLAAAARSTSGKPDEDWKQD